MVNGMKNISDDDLLQQARRFNTPALTLIYDRYNNGLYYYALRLLGDPALAEDCVAEIFRRFLQLLRNGGGPTENLKGYLFRSVHNWITDHYRQHPLPWLELDSEIPNPNDNPGEEAEKNIAAQHVRTALLTLTPDQRQVISLRYLEGWDFADIANSLNKPVGAIKSLQHRALASLQKLLLTELKVEI